VFRIKTEHSHAVTTRCTIQFHGPWGLWTKGYNDERQQFPGPSIPQKSHLIIEITIEPFYLPCDDGDGNLFDQPCLQPLPFSMEKHPGLLKSETMPEPYRGPPQCCGSQCCHRRQ